MAIGRSPMLAALLAAVIVGCWAMTGLGQDESLTSRGNAPTSFPLQPPQPSPTEETQAPQDYLSLTPDRPAPPPPPDGQADLEGRVSKLEQAIADGSRKGSTGKKSGDPISVDLSALIMFETEVFSQNANSQIQFPPGIDVRNAVGFRRARIGIQGQALEVYEYRFEPEFAGFTSVRNATDDGSMIIQQTSFKDVWLGMKEVPLFGSIRVGHFKEPFSLEQITRDRYGTFMERALPDEGALVPARNPGIMVFNYSENQRMTWQMGAFAPEISEAVPLFQNNHAGTAFTGRVTFLPWYDEPSGGRGYWHTGIAYSYRANATGSLLYQAKPEAFFGPIVVTTQGQLTGPNADVDHNQLLGAETVLVRGPLTVQAEYYRSFVDRTAHPDVQFSGYYGYVSWFLTGEYKPYNRELGSFNRIDPLNNFFPPGSRAGPPGWGAWLVAYRYSLLDLNDGLVQGGVAHDHTVGVNWYMNPYTRVQWNYVISDVSRLVNNVREGQMRVFEMRGEIEF